MTALWLDGLTAAHRVSVKPHASPVLHAINHLLGELDPSYLPRLREYLVSIGVAGTPARARSRYSCPVPDGEIGKG